MSQSELEKEVGALRAEVASLKDRVPTNVLARLSRQRVDYPAPSRPTVLTTWTLHKFDDSVLLPSLDGTVFAWRELDLSRYGVPTWATDVLVEVRWRKTSGLNESFYKFKGTKTRAQGIIAAYAAGNPQSGTGQVIVDLVDNASAAVVYHSILLEDFGAAVQSHLIGYFGARPVSSSDHEDGLTMDRNGHVTHGAPKPGSGR